MIGPTGLWPSQNTPIVTNASRWSLVGYGVVCAGVVWRKATTKCLRKLGAGGRGEAAGCHAVVGIDDLAIGDGVQQLVPQHLRWTQMRTVPGSARHRPPVRTHHPGPSSTTAGKRCLAPSVRSTWAGQWRRSKCGPRGGTCQPHCCPWPGKRSEGTGGTGHLLEASSTQEESCAEKQAGLSRKCTKEDWYTSAE